MTRIPGLGRQRGIEKIEDNSRTIQGLPQKFNDFSRKK